jgi:hypothetical protein
MKWRNSIKTVSILLIICLVFGSVMVDAAKESSTDQEKSTVSETFPDIGGHWCQSVIEKFLRKNWIMGYDDGLFRPDRLVTRAEFTTMVIKLLNKVNDNAKCSFKDVKSTDWFYKFAASSVFEKYIEGYPDNTFRPFVHMSREEVAAFVQRILKVEPFEGESVIRFKDEDSFSDWSAYSIKALASHEIVRGYEDGTFKPSRFTTRAEAVKMLDIVLKILKISEEPTEKIPGVVPTPTNTVRPTVTPTPVSIPYVPPVNSSPSTEPTPVIKLDIIAKSIDVSGVKTDSSTLKTTGSVTAEVYNAGPDNFSGNADVVVFEDSNSNKTFDDGDTVLGKTTLPYIAKNAAASVSAKIEGNVWFKENLIYVYGDSSNRISETNEDNNIISSKAGCTYIPPVGSFNPVVEWKWNSSSVLPDSLNVMISPAVIDLDSD